MRHWSRRQWYRAAAAATVLIALAIVAGTLTPPDEMPKDIPGHDKLHHFLGFAALVIPVVAYRPRNALWMVPGAAAFGVAIELIQPYFGRQCEIADMIANTAGAIAGAAVGTLLHRVLRRRLRG